MKMISDKIFTTKMPFSDTRRTFKRQRTFSTVSTSENDDDSSDSSSPIIDRSASFISISHDNYEAWLKKIHGSIFVSTSAYRWKYAPSIFTNSQSELLSNNTPFPFVDFNFRVKWIVPQVNDPLSDKVISYNVLSDVTVISPQHLSIFLDRMSFLTPLNGIKVPYINDEDFIYFRPENPSKIFISRFIGRRFSRRILTVEDINDQKIVLDCPSDLNRLILTLVS